MTATVAKVGDVSEQIRGVTYAKSDSSPTPGPGLVPVLRAGNITEHGLTLDDLVFVPENCVSERQRVRKHDVVIAASSGSLSVVGKAAAADADLEAGFGAFCKVLRPTRSVDPRYFSHFFRTPDYRRRMTAAAAGANINNLRGRDLDDLEIPLPPIEEQRRIAEVLDQADSARARRRKAVALLDSLTEAIFLDMFGDPLANPRGWPDPALGDLLTFQQYGHRFYDEPYSDEGVRTVRITDLNDVGELDFSAMPRMALTSDEQEKYLLRSGDLIFARSGATVGKVALIRSGDPPCIAGAYFITMRFDASIEPEYALAALSSRSIRALITRRSRQAAQQNFSGPALRRLPLPVPPPHLQSEFAARVRDLASHRSRTGRSAERLDELFASLQQRAFRDDL